MLLLAAPIEPTAAPLRAGLGQAPLPTPESGPLGGYGGLRERRAERVLDVPEARALVLERGALRIALVTLDLVIVRPALRLGILEQVEPLDLDLLVLLATHTHSGPGGYIRGWLVEKLTAGSFREDRPAALIEAARIALERAVADLAPATPRSGLADLELARNRHDPHGLHETSLPILALDRAGRARSLVLFSYAAHPTVLSPRSRAYSADYVGAARDWLEASGWSALFVPGPLGDQQPSSRQGPLWPRDVRTQQAQRLEIGERLGRAVQEALATLGPADPPHLAGLERWVDAPDPRLRRFCSVWWFKPLVVRPLRRFLSRRVPIHALQIGSARLLGLPAEPSAALGDALRQASAQGQPLFVMSHANDWLGYAVSAQRYRQGGYEACMSFHGAGFGRWLVGEATQTMRLLDSRARPRPAP